MVFTSTLLLFSIAVNLPGLHFAFTFHVHHAAWLADKIALDEFVGGARNLNRPITAVRFHAAGGVDGVTPQVVNEFFATDDARHHRSGVDADTQADLVCAKSTLVDELMHI